MEIEDAGPVLHEVAGIDEREPLRDFLAHAPVPMGELVLVRW